MLATVKNAAKKPPARNVPFLRSSALKNNVLINARKDSTMMWPRTNASPALTLTASNAMLTLLLDVLFATSDYSST